MSAFGTKADMLNALTNVRFEGNNGHDADVTRYLLMTRSGHHSRIEMGRAPADKQACWIHPPKQKF